MVNQGDQRQYRLQRERERERGERESSMDGIRKAELMKKLHEQVRLHIEEKMKKYTK